jgi:hypothetical protein
MKPFLSILFLLLLSPLVTAVPAANDDDLSDQERKLDVYRGKCSRGAPLVSSPT